MSLTLTPALHGLRAGGCHLGSAASLGAAEPRRTCGLHVTPTFLPMPWCGGMS